MRSASIRSNRSESISGSTGSGGDSCYESCESAPTSPRLTSMLGEQHTGSIVPPRLEISTSTAHTITASNGSNGRPHSRMPSLPVASPVPSSATSASASIWSGRTSTTATTISVVWVVSWRVGHTTLRISVRASLASVKNDLPFAVCKATKPATAARGGACGQLCGSNEARLEGWVAQCVRLQGSAVPLPRLGDVLQLGVHLRNAICN